MRERIREIIRQAGAEMGDAIAAGDQPVGLASDYLIKTGFSAIWAEQQEQVAQLQASLAIESPYCHRGNFKLKLRPILGPNPVKEQASVRNACT